MRKKVQCAFIALGSNIAPRLEHLKQAQNLLRQAHGVQVKAASPIYETAPKGYTDQADFLNQVLMVETILEARDLIAIGVHIEEQLKRVKTIKDGPRTIDVDLLAYEREQYITEQLTLPHPRLADRAFVLVPWADIAPDFHVVGLEKTVSQLLATLPAQEKAEVRLLDTGN